MHQSSNAAKDAALESKVFLFCYRKGGVFHMLFALPPI